MDKFIGTILDNRYELLEVIGVGGTAVVYKAKCHRLNRYVAVKILKEEYAQDEEFRRKFHDEAQAVAMLSHPNIVNVYDVSRSGSIEYIVMELIDGITLKEYLSRRGQLSPKEVTVFATQIARALEHAHSHNIIHRDIKPQNIMLLRDGTVKVADFGIAHFTNNDNTYCKGEAIGSVHYVSPEQAKGSFVDNRTDLYSLGVVMYEMITGRLPFEGDTPVSIALQHINSIALPPSIFAENVPPQLEEITMKAMNPSLSKRYTSAAQILKDLEEKMNKAAEAMEFEDAARYRDLLSSVRQVSQKQKITEGVGEDKDILALYQDETEAVVQVFFVRDGKLIGREHYYMTHVPENNKPAILQDFVKQFYAGTPFIPRELMLQYEIEDAELIEKWLSERKGSRVYLKVPKIGSKEKLVELAAQNAKLVLSQDREKLKREEGRTIGAVKEISDLLKLPLTGTARMEAYDISNINGFENVGSMVVYEKGRPKRSDYRKFRIQSVAGPDDYACMREVLTRRFRHGMEEQSKLKEQDLDNSLGSFTRFPDVLMMDGGKGQVAKADEQGNPKEEGEPVLRMLTQQAEKQGQKAQKGDQLVNDLRVAGDLQKLPEVGNPSQELILWISSPPLPPAAPPPPSASSGSPGMAASPPVTGSFVPGTESPSPSSPLTRWCSEKCWTFPVPSSIRD